MKNFIIRLLLTVLKEIISFIFDEVIDWIDREEEEDEDDDGMDLVMKESFKKAEESFKKKRR